MCVKTLEETPTVCQFIPYNFPYMQAKGGSDKASCIVICICCKCPQSFNTCWCIFFSFQNSSLASQDILIALLLEPSNLELMPIITRLFPGKSIKDVLHSRAAQQARHVLEGLIVAASPAISDRYQLVLAICRIQSHDKTYISVYYQYIC